MSGINGINTTIANGGTLQITAGSLSSSHFFVGYSGSGTVAQSGGNVSSNADFLYLGYNSSDRGTYLLSGGSLAITYGEMVGYHGTGVFVQTGGTNSAPSAAISLSGGPGTTCSYGARRRRPFRVG